MEWISPRIKGDIPDGLSCHDMVKLDNHRYFLIGGRDKYKKNCMDMYIFYSGISYVKPNL